MFEKPCRLARAARYFKGGGGGTPDVPSIGSVIKGAQQGFKGAERQYRNFAGREDLLNWQTPLLQQLGQYGQQAMSQFRGVPGQLLNSANQLRSQFANVPGQLMSQFKNLPGQYLNIMQGLLPQAQTGELTRDQRNQAIQTARAGAQGRGDIYSNPAIFAEAMNRRQYADKAQERAIGLVQGLGQSALQTALQRDTGAFGLASGREAAAMGLQQGAQGAAQGNEQLLGYPSEQLTKGELGRVGAYATLINPLYGLAGQQLQAQTSANVAGAGNQQSNKNSTIGTIGTVAAAALTAY